MQLAKLFLRLMAAMSIFFGVVYVAFPAPMLEAAGFGAVLPSGITDVRATYGGFQIGMGAFLLWTASHESRVRGGLLLVLFSIGAVGASRSLGMMFDGGYSSFHVAGLVTETLLTISALILTLRLPEEAAPAQAAG